MALSTAMSAGLGGVILLLLYLYRVNQGMSTPPPEALALSPRRWTDEEIRETYARVCKEPVDYRKWLPPKLERRYIVVGGSGLVGGDIVLHLLLRGQSPESIRILDFSPPSRPDLTRGPAADVDFVRVDISDTSSVDAAFARPWPPSVSALPLTVFHVAAAIRVTERSLLFWERSRRVNVDGTANVLAAAQATAGADVFIATSSAGIAVRPVRFFFPPWRARPRRMVQFCDEKDFFDKPVRPHDEFFGNYAHSKAIAERMVCGANRAGFRTGCLRPGNGIYGLPTDNNLGRGLTRADYVSINGLNIQNFVSAWNVSLAHLDYEAALTGTVTGADAVPKCSGRPFVITDNGPPPQWADTTRASVLLRSEPPRVVSVPPLPVYLASFTLEWWRLLLARFPFLTRGPLGLGEPTGDLAFLGPNVFTNIHACVICVDDAARRSVGEGGIGYRGGVTTLEGFCQLIRDWNEDWSKTWGKKEAAVVVPKVAA